jgi:spoIIIJ-associated protein
MSTKKEQEDVKIINEFASELLALIGISAEVDTREEESGLVVDIKSENETGLLIGNRGRNLNSIQALLGLMYFKKTDEWKRILVDIADWREKETQRLESLAMQAAQRAKETGNPQPIYNLTASQRRTIHTFFTENEEIETYSEGEEERYLVVAPKAS